MLDDASGDEGEVRQHPTVCRLRSLLAEDHSSAEFEEALERPLTRLTLIRSEHAADE